MFDTIPLVLAQDGDGPPVAPPSGDPPTPSPTNGGDGGDGGDGTPQELADGGNGTGPGTQNDQQSPGTGMGPNFMLFLILGAVVLFMIMTTLSQRKEKKKRQQMLSALTKGQEVQTVGGIVGTVVEVKEDTVTLKVDENSNTRMKFSRAAIQNVMDN